MKSTYWNSVKNRFLSLASTVLQTAVPVAVDATIVLSVNRTCSIIEQNLSHIYKKTAINSAITLLINTLGILILFFKPVNRTTNLVLAGFLFFGSFAFWLFRTVNFIKKNSQTSYELLKYIYKEKSIYNGTEKYIINTFPKISLVYAGISIGEKYIPSLHKIPSVSELIKYLVNYYKKQIFLISGIVSIYTILIYWIIKPIIIKSLI